MEQEHASMGIMMRRVLAEGGMNQNVSRFGYFMGWAITEGGCGLLDSSLKQHLIMAQMTWSIDWLNSFITRYKKSNPWSESKNPFIKKTALVELSYQYIYSEKANISKKPTKLTNQSQRNNSN